MPTDRQLPLYKSHKEVYALKIKSLRLMDNGWLSITPEDDGYAPFEVEPQFVPKHDAARPQAGWYYVVYSDGYKSFSPAGAFEEGYTRVEFVAHRLSGGEYRKGQTVDLAPFNEYLHPTRPVIEGLEQFETKIAETQSQYIPLRGLISRDSDGHVLTRWTLDPAQRQAVASGKDIFLELMTFNRGPQPVRLTVGAPYLSGTAVDAAYGLTRQDATQAAQTQDREVEKQKAEG